MSVSQLLHVAASAPKYLRTFYSVEKLATMTSQVYTDLRVSHNFHEAELSACEVGYMGRVDFTVDLTKAVHWSRTGMETADNEKWTLFAEERYIEDNQVYNRKVEVVLPAGTPSKERSEAFQYLLKSFATIAEEKGA